MIRLGVQRLEHGRDLPLPACHSAGAAGMDLHAALPEDAPLQLQPGRRACIPTGLVIALPQGCEAQIRPRSGLALHHGVTVLNAPGTIDSDYRGELLVLLINHGDAPFIVSRGMRIAQLVLARVEQAQWREQATDGERDAPSPLRVTTRAGNGFGSTGSHIRRAW